MKKYALFIVWFLIVTIVSPLFGFTRQQEDVVFDIWSRVKDEERVFDRYQIIEAGNYQSLCITARKEQEKIKIIDFIVPEGFEDTYFDPQPKILMGLIPVMEGINDFAQCGFRAPEEPGSYLVTIEGETKSGEKVSLELFLYVVKRRDLKTKIAVWEAKEKKDRSTVYLEDGNEIFFPNKFKSEDRGALFSLLGGMVGICWMVNDINNKPNGKMMWIIPPTMILPIAAGALGWLIGGVFDEIIHDLDYYNANQGWIKADEKNLISLKEKGTYGLPTIEYLMRDKNKTIEKIMNVDFIGAELKDIAYIKEDTNVYASQEASVDVGVIVQGEFRRIIEEKNVAGQIWYKVKIDDQPVFE